MMRKLFAPACFALLVIGTNSAFASCMPRVRWMHGQTVDGYMTVRSGKVCNINFTSRGPTDRTVILARPSNGTLTAGSIGRLTYKARTGYVGKDTFTYARRGMTAQNAPMDATIRVNVTVTQ